jgi:hypothetical protein
VRTDSQLSTDEGPLSEAIVCETCSSVLLYDGVSHSETGYWPELAYRETSALSEAVPETVLEIYQEASIVKQNAPNAFAVMIRKSLEAICDDRSVSKGSLAIQPS